MNIIGNTEGCRVRPESDAGAGMIPFHSSIISQGRYDVQCEIMELEFLPDGGMYRFYDVPEHIWYGLRSAQSTKLYFRLCIMGRYKEARI